MKRKRERERKSRWRCGRKHYIANVIVINIAIVVVIGVAGLPC